MKRLLIKTVDVKHGCTHNKEEFLIFRGFVELVDCIQNDLSKEQYCSIDELRNQTAEHRLTIINKLVVSDFGQWTQIIGALNKFDLPVCASSKYL